MFALASVIGGAAILEVRKLVNKKVISQEERRELETLVNVSCHPQPDSGERELH